jgi:predicted acyl esterase
MGMQALLAQVSKAMFKLDIDAGQYWEDERDDEVGVLTFTTDTLTEDVEISGPLTLTFWAKTGFGDPGDASSTYRLLTSLSKMLNIDEGTSITPFLNKRDVQWVVELNDVFKNGRARNITSGWLSAENRPYDVQNPTEVDRNYVAFDPFYDRSYKEPDPILADTVYKYVVEVWPTDNVFKKGHKIRISLSASDYPHLFPVFYPSENTIVIDDDHKARLDYTKVTGTSGAVWVDDPTEYVMNSLH